MAASFSKLKLCVSTPTCTRNRDLEPSRVESLNREIVMLAAKVPLR